MSNVDMEWARFLPVAQTITAKPPDWERPRFNEVGAMQAAQSYLANQQAMDLAKQEAPIGLALKKAQLAAAQHSLSRLDVGDKTEDLRLKAAELAFDQATLNAADANILRPQELANRKADLLRQFKAGEISDDQVNRTNVIGRGVQYVFAQPEGAERTTAWNMLIDESVARGVLRPEQGEAWKKRGPSKEIVMDALSPEALIKHEISQLPQSTTTDYDNLTIAQKQSFEKAVQDRAKAKVAFGGAITQEGLDAERSALAAQMKIRLPGEVPGGATKTRSIGGEPASTKDQSYVVSPSMVDQMLGYENALDSSRVGGGERSRKKADREAAQGMDEAYPPSGKKKPKGAGATEADPHIPPADLATQADAEAWMEKTVKPGEWFYDPNTKRAMRRRMN